MPASEIKELRKSGKLDEALAMAKAELEANPDNIWCKRNISWVYYEYLKKSVMNEDENQAIHWLNEIKALGLPDGAVMLNDKLAWQIAVIVFKLYDERKTKIESVRNLLELSKGFAYSKPREGYSILYKAFHRFLKDTPDFIPFADWWGFENFLPKDYEKEQLTNGQTIMAIAEQAYIAYSKALLSNKNEFGYPAIDKEKVRTFLPKLELLQESYPKYQYPGYFHAKLLLALGEREDMLKELLPFAKRKQSEFWSWQTLAEAFTREPEKFFSCYCKALTCRAQEEMLVRVRERMAVLFIERNLFNEAKTEIDLLVKTRISNKWSIPVEVVKWQNEDWFGTADIKQSNRDVYIKFAGAAEAILFADIPEELIFIDFVNKEKKILNYYDKSFQKGFLKYDRFLKNVNIGDVLSARFEQKGTEHASRAATLKKADDPLFKSKFYKEVEGNIQIGANKPYGFLGEIFINPKLVNKYQLEDNQFCKISARQSFNKERGKWQWSAIDVITN